MFSLSQNSPSTLFVMADDYDRLLLAAKKLKGWNDAAETARGLGKYDQIMTNWKARGIPRAEVMDIANTIGCDPYWLRDGVGMMDTKEYRGILRTIDKHPGLLNILKVAEPLSEYQVTALASMIPDLAKHINPVDQQSHGPALKPAPRIDYSKTTKTARFQDGGDRRKSGEIKKDYKK